MKQLGIIGGLGPMATAHFFKMLIKMTDATLDQEHIDTLIYSRASVPDRSAYIIGKSMLNPLDKILEIGKVLTSMGADYIAMPCVTAHYFYDSLSNALTVPMINIVRETVGHLKLSGIKTAGIMATHGTIKSMLFQTELEKSGITPLILSEADQSLVMKIIYDIKSNNFINDDIFNQLSHKLKTAGAEAVILGCTELSLLPRESGYIDALEALAARSILVCNAKLKKEYNCLIR